VEIIEFITQQWLLVSLLVALLYAYMWLEKAKGGKGVSVHGMTQLVNRDEAVVLDVRDAAEFKAGHIVDALNIPYNKVAERRAELDKYKAKTLVLVDKMGTHTGAVGRQLRKEGFTVLRLEGGMSEWQNQNLPLVKG
jgi:rhodanese-related sulfurtransferase